MTDCAGSEGLQVKLGWGNIVLGRDKATPLLQSTVFQRRVVWLPGQVGTIRFPGVANLGEDGRGEAQGRFLGRDEGGDQRSAFDLLVEPLEVVRGSEPPPARAIRF